MELTLVPWALVVISVLLVGCIITIYKNRFPLLQYVTVTVTIFYIVFSLAKPDYLIAKYNLTYNKESVDFAYLAHLSTDAVPAMEEAGVIEEILKDDGKEKRNLKFKVDLSNEMGILDFNFSYYQAGNILNRYKSQLKTGNS